MEQARAVALAVQSVKAQINLDARQEACIFHHLNAIYVAGFERGSKRDYVCSYNKKTKSKPVERLDEKGEVLDWYVSISSAAKIFEVHKSSIHKAIKNQTKCKQFFWKYA